LSFLASNDEDADTEEAGPPAVDQAIVPSFVFSLDASDDFIKERVMSLPESEVVGTKYSEEGELQKCSFRF
jgi:adenylate kinase